MLKTAAGAALAAVGGALSRSFLLRSLASAGGAFRRLPCCPDFPSLLGPSLSEVLLFSSEARPARICMTRDQLVNCHIWPCGWNGAAGEVQKPLALRPLCRRRWVLKLAHKRLLPPTHTNLLTIVNMLHIQTHMISPKDWLAGHSSCRPKWETHHAQCQARCRSRERCPCSAHATWEPFAPWPALAVRTGAAMTSRASTQASAESDACKVSSWTAESTVMDQSSFISRAPGTLCYRRQIASLA